MDNRKMSATEESQDKGVQSLRMLLVIVLVAAVGAPVVGAVMTINAISGKIAALQAGDGNGDGEDQTKEKPSLEFYQPLEFLVNLSDTDETHYLRATISLALPTTEAAGKEKPSGHGGHGAAKAESPVLAPLRSQEPVIRDLIIAVISSRTLKDLTTTAGKESLKESIRSRLQQQLGLEGLAIYFTSFTLQ